MSGTRPLLAERPRPVQPASAGAGWRQGLRQIAVVLTGSGSSSREETMTVLDVVNSLDLALQALEERV
jgi:hypothetical protein